MQTILERVVSMGEAWEGVFGGLLVICLPPGVIYDPSEHIEAAMAELED